MNKKFNLKEIKEIASDLLSKINKMDNKATVITMSGDLGAGKTTLTQEIAKVLGVKRKIISPTFVIMKKHPIKNSNFKTLIHIDAYRLNSSDELKHLGWDEISSNKENLIILEWPEKVPECSKKAICLVKLEHLDEKTRTIEICYN